MASGTRAVDEESLGAWLIKSRPESSSRRDWVDGRFEDVVTRCVRKSYRTDLVASGQAVLLWFSGTDPQHPAGIYAQGRTTGGAAIDGGQAWPGVAGTQLVMPVALEPVAPPVLRGEILLHPVLSRIEVLRMPAGSNPSFLTRTQLDQLRQAWPQVTVA